MKQIQKVYSTYPTSHSLAAGMRLELMFPDLHCPTTLSANNDSCHHVLIPDPALGPH